MNTQSKPRLLIGGMTENMGGREAYILHLFETLRNDFECWFLTDREIVKADEIQQQGGIIFTTVPRGSNPKRYLKQLTELFANNDFHAVWLNASVVNSIEPLVLAKKHGVPVRMLHSHSSFRDSAPLTNLLHNTQKRLVQHWTTNNLACSSTAGDWFFPNGNFEVMPNSFDVERFTHTRATRERVRAELGLGDDALAVVQVGRLSPEKNHTFSLEIVQALNNTGVNAVLLIVGDGPLRPELEARAADLDVSENVQFLGLRSDVADVLQAADVLLHPSTFEGLPYAILEGQAAGLSVLTSTAVSPEAAVTDAVRFVSVSEPAARWATDLIDIVASTDRVEGKNELRDGEYDSNTSRARYLKLLGIDGNTPA